MILPSHEADAITANIRHQDLVRGVQRFIRDGNFDPEKDIARSAVDVNNGHVLIMPSANPRYVGVKLATVNENSAKLGVPRIQGVYVLFDAPTLAPIALIDAITLTNLRTSSVSVALADAIIPPGPIDRVAVTGSGPQGIAHVDALASVREIGALRLIGRDLKRLEKARSQLAGRHSFLVEISTTMTVDDADVVVTATTAKKPLFCLSDLKPGATAIAVGSHEPTAREIAIDDDTDSIVIVDAVGNALVENGNVIIPIEAGRFDRARLQNYRDFVAGTVTREPGKRAVLFSSGMSWQDLVVAEIIHTRLAQ